MKPLIQYINDAIYLLERAHFEEARNILSEADRQMVMYIQKAMDRLSRERLLRLRSFIVDAFNNISNMHHALIRLKQAKNLIKEMGLRE